MVLEYLQIQNKACASLCFSARPPRIGYLSLWMHEGLSSPWFITPRGISATRNMKSRLAIKFPTPMSSDQMPAPGKTKLIKLPPSRAGKDVKCPGGCLSFDLTGTFCPLSGLQIMLRDHIFDTIAQIFCRTTVFQTFENAVILTILLSCNFKGLVFDFYLNRKRNKYWLAAYSCDLFTYQ